MWPVFWVVYDLTDGIDSVGGAVNCPGVTLDLGFRLLGQSALTFPLCIQDQSPAVLHYSPTGSGLRLSEWITDLRVRGQSVQTGQITLVSTIAVTFQQIQECIMLLSWEKLKWWFGLVVNTVATT